MLETSLFTTIHAVSIQQNAELIKFIFNLLLLIIKLDEIHVIICSLQQCCGFLQRRDQSIDYFIIFIFIAKREKKKQNCILKVWKFSVIHYHFWIDDILLFWRSLLALTVLYTVLYNLILILRPAISPSNLWLLQQCFLALVQLLGDLCKSPLPF